MKTTAAYKL